MRISLLVILSSCIAASVASGKYRKPPLEEILRTAPVIVDATVARIEPKTGVVHLSVHREFRGGTGAEELVLTKTYLTCVGGAPGFYGMEAGKRYVFILQAADTLYEGSTFFAVTGDEDESGSWRVHFARRPIVGVKPGITAEAFSKLLEPDTAADSKLTS